MSPNAALDSQITQHMPLVHRMVAHFARRLPRSVQRDDLVAAATFGLFQALRASQASEQDTESPMFAAYAKIRIRGAIVDELRRHDWSPRRRKNAEAEPAPAAVANDHGPDAANTVSLRPPPPANAAPSDGASVPPAAAAPTVLGFDDLPPAVALALGDDSASALEDLIDHRTAAAVRAALDELPSREKDIISMRYFEEMPSKTIAQVLGLSEARISQLHARATARLRDLLAADAPEVSRAA